MATVDSPNPYASPKTVSLAPPAVETIEYNWFVLRHCTHAYRFETDAHETQIHQGVIAFYKAHGAKLLSSFGDAIRFIREPSLLRQLWTSKETEIAQQIVITTQGDQYSSYVICHYHLTTITPDVFVGKDHLHDEVQKLAVHLSLFQ